MASHGRFGLKACPARQSRLTASDPLLPLVTGSYRAGQRRTLPGNLRRRLYSGVYSAHCLWAGDFVLMHDVESACTASEQLRDFEGGGVHCTECAGGRCAEHAPKTTSRSAGLQSWREYGGPRSR